MALNDTLSNALSHILNSEKVGKQSCTIRPYSKLILAVLDVFKENGYIKEYKVQEITKGGILEVNLNSSINKCGAIKPRFSIKKDNFEKFEKRYLPSKNFGLLLLSTQKGIMSHNQAQKHKIGGRLIAYVY